MRPAPPITPWARQALTPEALDAIYAAKHEYRLSGFFMGGDSPQGPWIFRTYVPDPAPESPYRTREVHVEGHDANEVALRALRQVRGENGG